MKSTINNIILLINQELEINLIENSKDRKRIYVFGRAILYDILRKHLNMTLSDIAKVFNKNHATVLHSLKQLPFLLKFDKNLAYSYNNIMYNWLGNVDNSVPVSDEELKTRIKYLINQNKMLNLKVDDLNLQLSHYIGKYHKYLELSQEWGFRVGDRFDEFKRKVNTLLNGM
jgi:hypothetical protein|tara:strand:- start:68 stop:583 length:516 start_codon:yes stop_codon:yes gene_type:complete